MTQRLCITLALCLILQSISGVLLQDPSEFGGEGNDAFLDEYITQVPTVGENDVAVEALADGPADRGLADGSMMFSGLDNPQTDISVPTLEDNGGEEPGESLDTSSTVTLSPMLRSDDSLDSVQEDASENLPTASPEHTFDPSWLRQDESLSMSNDFSDASSVPESNSTDTDNTVIASDEGNSTDVTNTDIDTSVISDSEADSTDITNTDTDGAVSTSTETNSTEVTSTETNGTEVLTSSEINSSGVTNPPNINDTMGSLNSVPENPTENKTAEDIPEPTVENIPDTTAENIPEPEAENTPEPEAENTPEPTAETIPETTAENIPEPEAENTPEPTAETIPETTAENIPEPEAENTPEPTAETIPETTAENIPEPEAENTPEPTAETIPETTAENIPEDILNDMSQVPPRADATALAKAAAAGNANQGSDTETQNNVNGRAWGVILGIAVTVGVVGLIIYVMQKRKQHRNFSHSKLVEEGHPDPVLRLDNSEPLDLKYDGFGSYNPGLQGDSIQMSNYPSGHSH